jgi:hypothetical protein
MNEELSPRRLVLLEEEDGNTEMEVYLELEIGEQTFALLTPLDLPIHLVRDLGDGQLEPVEGDRLPELVRYLDDAMKPWGIKSELDGEELFLVGDPPDEFFDACEFIEVDADGEEDEYAIVVQIETGDETFLALTSTMPDLYPAELMSEERARPLTDVELTDLEETFRLALREFDEFEEEEEEGE